VLTLARIARTAGAKLVSSKAIEEGLLRLGGRATQSLDDAARGVRADLIGEFVRGLYDISVEAAHDLERVLLVEANAAPDGIHDVAVSDAISLVRARNHVGQITKLLGLSWSDAMRVQSAIAELVRFAAAHGGGLLQSSFMGECADFNLKMARIGTGSAAVDPAVLGTLRSVCSDIRVRTSAQALQVHFLVRPLSQSGVA
jgi:hypothetical protein